MPTGLDDGPCQIDSKENKSQQYHLIEKQEREGSYPNKNIISRGVKKKKKIGRTFFNLSILQRNVL